MPGTKLSLAAIAVAVFGVAATALPAWSQTPPATIAAAAAGAPLAEGQLDQLLAPIALYPDTLLAQILMAATYPLEVVEADRWVQDPAHAALKGDQLVAALQSQPWDPSVKSLVPFPRVLQMMDSRLDWMTALGDAFLAQQAAVMDSVQHLRRQAQSAGTLQSTPHETVANDGEAVTIESVDQAYVYVPVYQPALVYAPWPWPDYPPFWFPPPVGFDFYGEPFLWWDVPVILPLWGWCRWHWHHHELYAVPGHFHGGGRPPPEGAWRHDPAHRLGVPYRNPETARRFTPDRAATHDVPRIERGFSADESRRPEPGARPSPEAPHAPPFVDSLGAGHAVRDDADRGRSSRMSMPRSAPVSHGFGGRPR